MIIAGCFIRLWRERKMMSEKKKKKNANADGEMAARGVAGALPCAQNEK